MLTLPGLATAQTWVDLFPSGGPPAPRRVHTAVYDPATNRMILFGGAVPPGVVDDVWVLTNVDGLGGTPTWTQLSPTGGPPSARWLHGAVYDPGTNRMIVYEGDPNPGSCFGAANDVWVLSNANGLGGTPTWTQLSPTGGPPAPRQQHSAVFNSTTNRMTVVDGLANAGFCGDVVLGDVWVLTGANGSVTITVAIDIKPGSFPNSIDPQSKGVIPVAILTTGTFDATTVDPNTVRFGATGTEAAPVHSAQEDVDGDGDIDLILQFNTKDTGILCGDTSASLTGQTFGGQAIEGSDSIRAVPCK